MKIKLFTTIFLIIIFYKADLRSQWVLMENLDSHSIFEVAVKDNFIFAGTETSGAFRSSDNGVNWTPVNAGLNSTYVTSFAITAAGIFVAAGDGVFYSINNGNTWSPASSGLSGGVIKKLVSRNNNVYAGHILAGVFKTTNNGNNWTRYALGEGDKLFTIYAAPAEFYISIAKTILRTTDDGGTFNTAVNGLTNLRVMTLSSYQNDLYAGTEGGIFHSTDIGNNWTRVSNGLSDTVFNVIINKNENVFAGSESGGVFLSTNKGSSWTSVNSGLTDLNITTLSASQDYIFAGTVNGNVWRRPLSEIPLGINSGNEILSEDFVLIGNYPNPFNPSTKILFSVKKNFSGAAKLKIYNSAGKLIGTDIINVKAKGIYEMTWNSKDLPSGVYFYMIELGSTILKSKMVLLR